MAFKYLNKLYDPLFVQFRVFTSLADTGQHFIVLEASQLRLLEAMLNGRLRSPAMLALQLLLPWSLCCKASGSPIFGSSAHNGENRDGTIACRKIGPERMARELRLHGQDNEPLFNNLLLNTSGSRKCSGCLGFHIRLRHRTMTMRASAISTHGWGSLNSQRRSYGTARSTRPRKGIVDRSPIVAYKVKGASLTKFKTPGTSGLLALEQLRKDNQSNYTKVNSGLLKLVASQDVLEAAYLRIKSRPGNMTPGSDGATLDGISSAWLKKLADNVGSGRFKPSPARRVMIPKAGGGQRSLSFASPRDKVVQEAMRAILEAIFEPSFSDFSHGFRPSRSCHTALHQIKLRFQSMVWFIEGDISKCFDSIDLHVLANLLKKRISDTGFIDLYWKMARSGYLYLNMRIIPEKGTPQGSVVSPILANIYLSELDKWIEQKIAAFDKGETRAHNKEYARVSYRLGAKECRKRHIPSRDPFDPNYRRLRYVRYADDFLIGTICSKQEAERLIEELRDFLKKELKLDLSLANTKLTHATTESARFLGASIRIRPISGHKLKAGYRCPSRPVLNIPLFDLVDKLRKRGYMKGLLPVKIGRLYILPADRIVRFFQAVFQGLANFYSFADDRYRLISIDYILRHSCAKTLGGKFHLTRRQIFKKYGRDMTIKDDQGKVLAKFTGYTHQAPMFLTGKFAPGDPSEPLNSRPYGTASPHILQAKTCCICGSTEKVEMHHVKHLNKWSSDRGIPVKADSSRILLQHMRSINRKQIPLCSKCHDNVHAGRYDGRPLKSFPGAPGWAASIR